MHESSIRPTIDDCVEGERSSIGVLLSPSQRLRDVRDVCDVDLGAFVDERRVGSALRLDAPVAHAVGRTALFPTPVEWISLLSLHSQVSQLLDVWATRQEAYSALRFGRRRCV